MLRVSCDSHLQAAGDVPDHSLGTGASLAVKPRSAHRATNREHGIAHTALAWAMNAMVNHVSLQSNGVFYSGQEEQIPEQRALETLPPFQKRHSHKPSNFSNFALQSKIF